MKLSVCIPVYNFDVQELIFDLKKEIENNKINAEIILIDDASNESFKQINTELQKEVEEFIFLEKNIGRSQIRNLFTYYSKGDYLLFLDCDGKIIDKNFLKNYLEFIEKNPKTLVVYGGRKVSEEPSDESHYLRWKFAVERENLPVSLRKEKPYLSFQTNNFVIKSEVLQKIHFNPEFQRYGYEDLLFAMDLKSENIIIDHIENPIFNNDLEENKVYLSKVEESVESLAKMLKSDKLSPKIAEVKLVKAYNQLSRASLKTLFIISFGLRKDSIKKMLLKGNVNLRYLDLYKLGLLLEIMK